MKKPASFKFYGKTIPSRPAAYLLLSINTLVWGASFVFIKPAFEITTPYRFLFYRFVLAAIFSIPFFWKYRQVLKSKFKNILWKLIPLELLGTVAALSLLYAGLNLTSVLEANLIATSLPFFVTLGGVYLLKERQEKHEWLGLIIALLATVFLIAWPAIQGPSFSMNGSWILAMLGNILILGQNIANAFFFPLAKKAYQKYPKLLVSSLSYLVGIVGFGVISLGEAAWSISTLSSSIYADWQHPIVWFTSLYAAIAMSIIGLTTYLKGQDLIEASEASLFYYLQPLVYIPLAWVLLGDIITAPQLFALSMILVGVGVAERRTHQRLRV